MSEPAESTQWVSSELRALAAYAGESQEFWARYLALLGTMAGADAAALLRRGDGAKPLWQMLVCWPDGGLPPEAVRAALGPGLERLADAAAESGEAVFGPGEAPGGGLFVALRADSRDSAATAVVALRLSPENAPGDGDARLPLLRLVGDLVGMYRDNLAAREAWTETAAYRRVLETVTAFYGPDRFVAACFTLCNELAARFSCDQVSLGLLEHNEYMRMASLSRMAEFDRRSDVIRDLEGVIEEAADQQEEILWPAPKGADTITRQHENYARRHGLCGVLSAPVFHEGKVAGGICCERGESPFSEAEARQISLVGQLVGARLLHLRHRDRWFPLRWAESVRAGVGRLVGVEHTWAKVLGIACAGLVFFLAFWQAPYRLEAPFLVKARDMAALSAPLDGFVENVSFDVGDRVEDGQELIVFDRRALLLERASVVADLERYRREGEKSLAEDRLADMQINNALFEQTRARLDLVDYRLEQSVIRAPFPGVVVAGEWREKINSSVRQGEPLLSIARLEHLYVELDIRETDVADVSEGMLGEAAFAGEPGSKVPVRFRRLNAAAEARPKGAVFTARADFAGEPRDWWRPGMGGVAKLDVGKRPLWWIFAHRTIDFLRMKFWW